MFIILTLIITVAAFNIISSMIMFVNSKSIDIVFRAMGHKKLHNENILSNWNIDRWGRYFSWNNFRYFILLQYESIRQFLEKLTNYELFSAEIYFLTKMPALMDPIEVFKLLPWLYFFLCSFYLSSVEGYKNTRRSFRYE